MIEFLTPLWLIAAGAAAIPLFIHLLRRRTGTRVEFPAVRYLARAEREHSRNLKLRNLLLMLLRVAAIVLIATAAARPLIRVAGSGHAPTAMAIVLDNSLSTSAIAAGRPVLEELRAVASGVASRAAATDRVWLITADGTVHGGTRDAVVRAIEHTGPLAGAGNVEDAAVRAASLVGGSGLAEREVAIMTDGQATSWSAPITLGQSRVQLYRPRQDAPRNRAVVEAEALPPRWTPRGAVRARVLTPDSAAFRITIDGRTLARGTAVKDQEILVRASPAERGWSTGTVEVEPDELRGDDARYFAAWIGPAPAVHVSAALGLFAMTAVEALVQAERATMGSDVTFSPADEATALPALLVAPADPVHIGAANRALARLDVPWRFGDLRRGESAVESATRNDSTFRDVSVLLRYRLVANAPNATDTLAVTASEPWIVAGPGYVLVASPLTPEATTLPVRAAFVPWLAEMFSQRLGREAGTIVDAIPGAMLARPAGVDALELPEGQRQALSGDSLAAPDESGVYPFLTGSARAGALVVNPEPAESELRRLSPQALASRIRAASVRSGEDSAAVRAHAFDSAPRRPLVLPLLLLAVVALVAESALTGRSHGGA
ncbi:MAG: BatA domain-containing protein [Gemmatimonadaceae bacterium]